MTQKFLPLLGLLIASTLEGTIAMEAETSLTLKGNDYAAFRQSFTNDPLTTQEKLRALETLSITEAPSFNASQFLEILPYLSHVTSLTLKGVVLNEDLSKEMEANLTSLMSLKVSSFDKINMNNFKNIKTLESLNLLTDIEVFLPQDAKERLDVNASAYDLDESDYAALNANKDKEIVDDDFFTDSAISYFDNGNTFNSIKYLTIDAPYDYLLEDSIKENGKPKQLSDFLTNCEEFFTTFPNLEEFVLTNTTEIDWAKFIFMEMQAGMVKVARFYMKDLISMPEIQGFIKNKKENPEFSTFDLTGQIEYLKTTYPKLKKISGEYIKPTITL